jgi:dTDP-glucose 4,6-dehydratase
MPRTLVTGGAGFLGSHLCEYFLNRGHDVIAMDNLLTGNVDNIAHLRSERFTFVKYDVTNYIYMEGPIDYILHFASPASPRDYLEFPIQTLKVGSIGTHKALGLAHAKKARFLLASTSEVYGDPLIHPQPETYWGNVDPVSPRGVYDEAKRFAEALTMAYRRYHGVETRIVRIFNTYGPRMRPEDGRAIPTFVPQVLRGEPITVFGDGSQTRSFCYVSDLIEGIYRLLMSDYAEPVNIGTSPWPENCSAGSRKSRSRTGSAAPSTGSKSGSNRTPRPGTRRKNEPARRFQPDRCAGAGARAVRSQRSGAVAPRPADSPVGHGGRAACHAGSPDAQEKPARMPH